MKPKFVISTAHYHLSHGAEAYGRHEHEWSGLFVSSLLKTLSTIDCDAIVFDTDDRETDIEVLQSLTPYDLCVEFHLNAWRDPTWRNAIILHQRDSSSDFWATELTDALKALLPWPVSQPVFWNAQGYGRAKMFFTQSPPPALIVEVGFITNDRARAWLFDQSNLDELAKGLAAVMMEKAKTLRSESGNDH